MAVGLNITQTQMAQNFKGKRAKTQKGNDYYKTTSGTTAGAILAVPAALMHISNAGISSFIEGMSDGLKKNGADAAEIKEIQNIISSNVNVQNCKKYAFPFAAIAAGLTVGCGMLVDHIRNKKAAQTADYVNQVGLKNAMISNDKVALTYSNKPYYDSNDGKKWGALLGAGCGITAALMNRAYGSKSSMLGSMLTFAIGGLLMGAITDSNTNKKAQKYS